MSLRLFTSNAMEILAEELARILRSPLDTPLEKDIVVVQSRGMERWVSMELARYNGICANCWFPFPNSFLHYIFRGVLDDTADRSIYDPEIMMWKVFSLLPDLLHRPAFEGLRVYLDDSGSDLKRLQLSDRISHTFDQYLLYRPEMIIQWEGGEEDHWQAILWRELVTGSETKHRAAQWREFLRCLMNEQETIDSFPARVSIFGISALPRFHIEVLDAMSRVCDVNLFLMNPCREYWGDILTGKEMNRMKARVAMSYRSGEELYLERGNSLLASMGTLGRDFFDMIYDRDYEEVSHYKEPDETSLLAMIQSDILNLYDRQEQAEKKTVVSEDDRSIQIHSCHSPMREVETLFDSLLDMFEKDSDLMPKDIIVMTPDIEKYAPYIQAVFDMPRNDLRMIPFSIADRTVRRESKIAETFMAIVDCYGSRYEGTRILSILESESVQRRFGITSDECEQLERWMEETKIRWGIDGKNRGAFGLHPFEENTWKAGLERILLGYALPGGGERMLSDVLPYDNIEGSETLLLGRFLEFIHQLFRHVSTLGTPETLQDWSRLLTDILDGFFAPGEDTEREIHTIRRTIGKLQEIGKLAGSSDKVDIGAIRWYLATCLETTGLGFGFMTGAVTFCAMLPMRSIPFKVVCCLGINGDAYPRQSPYLGFDFIANHPQPGDRSRRNDDRYLFLEAILSARSTLYISYVGQNVQDNSVMPPSVMVSELLDYIEEGFDCPEGTVSDHVITVHRLQAFNPGYFITNTRVPSRLFSYSRDNLNVAERLMGERVQPVPFIAGELSEPGPEWQTVEINELCRFFINPARYILNKRLGIYLEVSETVVEDRETFSITGLKKYHLEEEMVRRRINGYDLSDFLPVARAEGKLPHGKVGEYLYAELSEGVDRFVSKTETYMQGESLDPLEIEYEIGGYRITGRIEPIYHDHLLRYRYGRVTPRDHLRMWIFHLLLNIIGRDGYPRESILVALDARPGKNGWRVWSFAPVDDGEEILKRLMELYRRGLQKPLHFFPGTSWEYLQMLTVKDMSPAAALERARSRWKGNDFNRGEGEDEYHRLCFGNYDPLDSEFQELSEAIIGPLVRHQRERMQ